MPELEQQTTIEIISPNSSLPVSPYILSPISSDASISHESEIDIEYVGVNFNVYIPTQYGHYQLLFEPTLREILVRAANTNELETVSKVQLQVVAFETSLQRISIHIPRLTELILDGSVLMSLRDLGTGLKYLKILSVARCGLTNLDGLFHLETLEEFYAQDNRIMDLSPCGFLSDIRVLNLGKNVLRNISTIGFLSTCKRLEHLVLDGNRDMYEILKYRRIIKSMLPNLKTLDNEDITLDEIILESNDIDNEIINSKSSKTKKSINSYDELLEDAKSRNILTRKRNTMLDEVGQFVVSFSPKVLSPRSTSGSLSDAITSSYVLENNDKNRQHSLE
ncbi:hypothetical protein RN001_002926 [Aquatica leii]|uniref:Leucine-rich repeat-containing protein 56 n=1 Tax=Aquatica leii TaxID=1421715 RepID=A0AAN7QBB8_9COLE|nr:hypothetical protein RN001_002926 [Aquatica leii]